MRYPFRDGKLTGYIDESGRVVVKPKHVAGGTFFNGVAHTSGHNEHVFIDEKGAVLFRVPQMTHFEPFGPDGLAYFSRWDLERGRQRASFRDKTGKETVLDLDDASSPHDGLAAGRRDRGDATSWIGGASYASQFDPSSSPWGYVDPKGRFVIEERFVRACAFSCGRAAVMSKTKKGDRWGFVDAKGNEVVAPKYDGVSNVVDGIASVGVRDDAFTMPKKSGTTWDPRFELAWGLVDADGKKLLPPKWRTPLVFASGIAPACEEPWVFGILDRKGRFVSDARFASLHPFVGGVSTAKDRKTSKWGVVASDGTWLSKPAFESMGPFVGALSHATRKSARALGKTRMAYVDRKGEVVFEYAR